MSKYLVTTALEETWPEEGSDVLFLGEWCRLYDRKEKWSKYDFQVAPYHWDDRNKLFRDYNYLEKLYEVLLVELSKQLNELHHVNYSLRYWRLLIGFWLGWFLQTLYDRWYMLEFACSQYSQLSCRVIDRCPSVSIPNDTSEFCTQACFDDWNEAIYTELLKMYFSNCVSLSKLKPNENSSTPENKEKSLSRKTFKKTIRKGLKWFNQTMGRKDDYFFINSYLPRTQDLKLQWKLGQIPKIWEKESTTEFSVDLNLRNFTLSKTSRPEREFCNVVRELIPIQIPKVFLEGFQVLQTQTQRVCWPKKPKTIFTSNSIFYDDFFKFWAAKKIETGTKLIIGQHGGNFGMSKFSFHERYQIEIADKWLSWGWESKGNPKIVPVGNIKSAGSRIPFSSKREGLLVGMELPRYSYHLYSASISATQWISYFQDQVKFLSELPIHIRKFFLVRPHKGMNFGNCFKKRIREHFKDVTFDTESKMETSAKKSRMLVSTYNATTYLESLFWNIPTICFWNPLHWELNDCAKPYFSLLKDAGIYHETPEAAARQVSEIWDDVASWWESEVVKSARNEFCDQYSKQIKNMDETANYFLS